MNILSNNIKTIHNLINNREFLKRFSEKEKELINSILKIYIHEAQWAIEFLAQYDVKDKYILEIGAGAGIVSACLHMAGAHVTMVEPSQGAFSHQEKIYTALHAHLGITIPLITTPIEEISAEHAQYDFIFSINVLEHIMNLPAAFSVMSSLLKDDGMMFHICPNYFVPYEPHVGALLVPFFPDLSLRFSKKIAQHPVANMLNFITVGTIKKLAKRNGLSVRFYKDMMYRSFMRLQYDREFQKRQSGLPFRIFHLLTRLKLIGLTKYVPVCLQTPVAFEMRKK